MSRTVKLTEYGTCAASWFYEVDIDDDDSEAPSDPAALAEWVKKRILKGDFAPYDCEMGDAEDGGDFSEVTVIDKPAFRSVTV